MDGFGVHTFRFVNDDGDSKLVKFHFKTKQGLASLVWSEALVLNGQNPDYHREDLFKAIESGNYPEWEIGVQIMEESDVLRWGFDLLDPTKIVPVELAPITPLGKLVLNKNTVNYFAETEQSMVSIHLGGFFGSCRMANGFCSSVLAMWFVVSTLRMIRFSRAVFSRMLILRSTVMADPTLSSSRL